MGTTVDDMTLAELLCARLCHDLAGPVGAAAAGSELLEDGCADAETLALVAASAGGAVSRLKFLRAAFGPAGQPQSSGAIRELASAHFAASAAAAGPGLAWVLDWRVPEGELPAQLARLLLNLLLLGRDALPKGGTVTAESGQAGALATVTARGEPAVLSEEIRAILADGAAPQGPRAAQAALARHVAAAAGGELVLRRSDSVVELRVQPSGRGKSHSDG